eukprot:SAG11_NODE_264_length_11522_cov_14.739210_2_plen_464_part_00
MSGDTTQNPQNKRPATGTEVPTRDDQSRLISELIASRSLQERALAQQQELLLAQREELQLLREQSASIASMAQQALRGAPTGRAQAAQQHAAAGAATQHAHAVPQVNTIAAKAPEDMLPATVKTVVDKAVTDVTALLNRMNNAKTALDKLCALRVSPDPSARLPIGCPKQLHKMQAAELPLPDGFTLGTVAEGPGPTLVAEDLEEEPAAEAPPRHMYGDEPLKEMNLMVQRHVRAAQIEFLTQLCAVKRSVVADDTRAIDATAADVEQKMRECLTDTCIPTEDSAAILRAAGQMFADRRSDVIAKIETRRKEEARLKALKAQELEDEKLQALQRDNSSTVAALIDQKLAAWEAAEAGTVDPSDPKIIAENAEHQQRIAGALTSSKSSSSKNGSAPRGPRSRSQNKQQGKGKSQSKGKNPSKGKGKDQSNGQGKGQSKGQNKGKGKGKSRGRGAGTGKRGAPGN